MTDTSGVSAASRPGRRAIFLDRDGTLIRDKHYLHRPEEVELFDGVGVALRRLSDAGFDLFVVTNQSGVGRGYFTLDDVHAVHRRLDQELAPWNIRFVHYYSAPEAPDQPSRGRKPEPGFLLEARDRFGIDLSASYMIGDKDVDVECGRRAGVRYSLLVRTGYGAEHEKSGKVTWERAVAVDGLKEAADWILKDAAAIKTA